jgi:hypothetical protein
MGDSPVNLDTFLSFNLRIVLAGAVLFLLFINLKDKSSGYVVVAGVVVLYLFTFITGRYYLSEGYEDVSGVTAREYKHSKKNVTPSITKSQDQVLDSDSRPFYDKPINDVDDYEYSMIFENENDREITKELRNKLMSQYPMDWTTNPPSSSNFTKGMKDSKKNVEGTIAENPTMFQNISADNVNPPDTSGIEEEERKILQTYQPKNNKDLKTYDVDDAYTLIKKIYDTKGEIPYVRHKKDTNVYEIVGTRRKDAQVVYDDEEAPYNPDMTGESDVTVPQAAVDKLASVDPYFDTHNRTRMDKNNYTRYTPGLERMFAPTFETEKWY